MQHLENAPPAPARAPSPRGQLALFAKNFFLHPKMLGSLIPSSRFLSTRLLGQVDWGRADVIVEYGPGVGTLTGEILRRMRPSAALVVIETNPEFVDFLRAALPDPRLHVVHGSAAEVERVLAERGLPGADYVISGIPFSTIPESVRRAILERTRRVLRPEGAFLVYQFSPKVLGDLHREFPRVTRDFEPLNVLPAQLFYCTA
ncbi:MAG TPA: methyltransferase domain-containing protein [Rubricoccaceae bacterium]|nr:methyltransferase domain-containing protein [Rubricoccaceae bacterium]